MSEPVLEVDDLVKHFPVKVGAVVKRTVGHVRAVDGVSFALNKGETLGIVGESGCGKSTLAQVLMRLEPPTSGSVRFHGEDIFARRGAELRALRRQMQIVLQDRPGALFRVMSEFHAHNVNIIEIYHQRIFTTLPAKGLTAEIECEARDGEQIDRLVDNLRAKGYSVELAELA